MKKIFFVLLTLLSINTFAQSNLSSRLSTDENFIQLLNLYERVAAISDRTSFLEQFDKDKIGELGNDYLGDITGYSGDQIVEINNILQANTESVYEKFPELKDLSISDLEETIKDAANLDYSSKVEAQKSCADCKREGKAQLAAGIFLGGATGSVGGLFGAWAGATIGFWAAGEIVISCLKSCH